MQRSGLAAHLLLIPPGDVFPDSIAWFGGDRVLRALFVEPLTSFTFLLNGLAHGVALWLYRRRNTAAIGGSG